MQGLQCGSSGLLGGQQTVARSCRSLDSAYEARRGDLLGVMVYGPEKQRAFGKRELTLYASTSKRASSNQPMCILELLIPANQP